MGDTCGDNRFELIEKYKQKLLDATNIEDSPEEMAVIDNILFRFWQMGWLDKDTNVTTADCISRQAAIDSLGEEPPVWYDGEEFLSERIQWRRDVNAIKAVPSIQSDVSSTIQNAINASTGNNDYMIGLRNGMRWCLSVLDGNEPGFEECSSAMKDDTISRAAAMMEYKVSKGFLEDIANFARFCDENDTDSMEIEFTLNDGRKAIAEMTFRTEDGDGNEP